MVNNGQKTSVPDLEYLSSSPEEILKKLNTSLKGLSEAEAERRREKYGYNEPARKKKRTIIVQILSRFINPLVIVRFSSDKKSALSWFF
jgi:magnesium-transporting ATPase (P-type)